MRKAPPDIIEQDVADFKKDSSTRIVRKKITDGARDQMANIARFFRSLFRSRKLRYSDAEILFLSTFLYPRALRDSLYAGEADWIKLLIATPAGTLARFLEDELIAPVEPHVTLLVIASAEEISRLARVLHADIGESAYLTARSIVRVLKKDPTRYHRLFGTPMFQCTELGKSIATAFIARAGINPRQLHTVRPPRSFVTDIKNAVQWFIAAAAGGVIGNRTDALFVELQQQKIRAEHTATSEAPQADDHAGEHEAVGHQSADVRSRADARSDTDGKQGSTRTPPPDPMLAPGAGNETIVGRPGTRTRGSGETNEHADELLQRLSSWWHQD